jgi:hypothetical protein
VKYSQGSEIDRRARASQQSQSLFASRLGEARMRVEYRLASGRSLPPWLAGLAFSWIRLSMDLACVR